MPRLKDLLEYIATPGLEDIWILLDIKVPWPAFTEPLRKNRADEWQKLDNIADDVMRLIASTIAEVAPSKPWKDRVVLGCWAVRHLVPHQSYPLIITNGLINRPSTFLFVQNTCLDSQLPTLDLASCMHDNF